MNLVEILLVVGNATLGFAAAVVNGRAARRVDPRARVMFGAIAALALAYSAAFIWLALFEESRSHYGSVVRGFALVAWPLVWISPASTAMKAHKLDVAKLEELRDRTS
jgi:hypothetical protein